MFFTDFNIPVKSCFPAHSCTSWKNSTLTTTVIKPIELHISANFKKVSQLASSSPLITPSVDIINECVSHLVDTHPVLVLQWCQVLRQVKYMDAQFWCGFIDTGTRLSTGKSYTSCRLRLIAEIQRKRCVVLIGLRGLGGNSAHLLTFLLTPWSVLQMI